MPIEFTSHLFGETAAFDDSEDDEVRKFGQQGIAYAEATSIHGLKYIGEPKRHWCERLGSHYISTETSKPLPVGFGQK